MIGLPCGQDDGGEGTTAAAPAGSAVGAGADVEVLLDLLTVADLRAEAERVLERCVLKVLSGASPHSFPLSQHMNTCADDQPSVPSPHRTVKAHVPSVSLGSLKVMCSHLPHIFHMSGQVIHDFADENVTISFPSDPFTWFSDAQS